MDSYPPEFLYHPQPLMFVAGLSESPSTSQTTRDRSASILSTSSSRRPSHGAGSMEPSFSSPGLSLTSPSTSPGVSIAALPQSPPAEDDTSASQLGAEVEPSERDKEFKQLLENLKSALSPKSRKGQFWIPESHRNEFRILLVDKGVRLPVRKVAPPAGSTETSPHSPLSPLTPTSPVHPDGLIAPIWVRKHAELIPSVFVLFLRLYESPAPPAAESSEEKDVREKAEREKEKEMDDGLVKEIGDRRRRLGERGIKLTVVLMASSDTLDSPHLDPRLSYLRRASQLSARASLFVLTPVPAYQLPDFVQSLQDALYEHAMEYYGSHVKRIRRKRARMPGGQFVAGGGDKARVLGSQGWGLRYDWKSGWFAELRGEFETARRHYEDCWNELARMFSSTQTLPPRSKRWAEAKVLADCVAVRICRLMLYGGDISRITTPFFVHVKRFSDLSRGWGIGEDTFEYWSWIARQYRIFAELLELAQDGGITIPPLPIPLLPTAGPLTGPPTPEHWSTPISATNPMYALQQPAFYFYTAALCSVERQRRYDQALQAEEDSQKLESGSTAAYAAAAPGFANEKKVDHPALIVELFTKAYTLLKGQKYSRDHASLHMAYKIGETYSNAGQYDMAMKFFERISPSFQADRWDPIVRQIRNRWYKSAQANGSVEVAAKLLFELMCPDSGIEGDEKASLQEDLLSLLKTTSPSSADPLVIDMTFSPLLSIQAGFWDAECTLPSRASLQIALHSPQGVDISSLTFSELHISLSDGRPDVIVKGSGDIYDFSRVVHFGDAAQEEVAAPLKFDVGSSLISQGHLAHEGHDEVSVSAVKMVLREGSWLFHLIFTPHQLVEWFTHQGSLTRMNGFPSTVAFVAPAHNVTLDIRHHPSAYVDETLPITIEVTNHDDRPIDARLSFELQHPETEDGTTIAVDDEVSASNRDLDLGTLAPRSNVGKIIQLKSPVEATKMVEVTLHTSSDGHTEESSRTAVVPILRPFSVTSTVTYQNRAGDEGMATVRSVIGTSGPRDVIVESLSIQEEPESSQRFIRSSIDGTSYPQTWDSQTAFAVLSQFTLRSARRASLSGLPLPPAKLVFNWHSANDKSVTTSVDLPPLVLPQSLSLVSAKLSGPSSTRLHEAFTIALELGNSHSGQESIVHIDVSTAEAFVWRGGRSLQILLAPGEEKRVNMEMVCVGGPGWNTLPRMVLWESRGTDEGRREVKVTGNTRVYVRP